mgnify:CR=1 FL=1
MDYYINCEKSTLDPVIIQRLLEDCFWSKNIPLSLVEKFIKHSLCFGAYSQTTNKLIGFGRVISDYTTFAYITDVVINPLHRNKGIGTTLINDIFAHPELQNLKTWSLRTTKEARAIYINLGFVTAKNPETLLEIENLNIYSDEVKI